jgi:cytochrome P450
MIDFLDKAFIENPYPALQQLRAEGKPIWHEGVQMYLAARYDDANEVLRTKSLGRIFKAKDPEFEWDVFNWLHADSILDSEPPKHTRLRSLVAKAFNRNKIESQRPAIEAITNELLDTIEEKIAAGQTFDVIADYAEPLPVKVIAAL